MYDIIFRMVAPQDQYKVCSICLFSIVAEVIELLYRVTHWAPIQYKDDILQVKEILLWS